MTTALGQLSIDEFLKEFWQKKPCLIRQAFNDYEPPLDGDDLAGLACEEMTESRLVKGTFEAADWSVAHGPFKETDFATLPEENWTLLVQDVEKHYAPLMELLQRFSFIPDWRLDDLMISYASSGGSVGPHIDQYDVFLLQVEGQRRWQIADSFDPELLENCPLNVLREFNPEQSWLLNPGDMLYLPPNVAHHGVALEPGMTWSIGSRAPSAADLLQGLGEWLAFTGDEGGRYSDPDLKSATRAGELSSQALEGLRQLMLADLGKTENLDNYLAAFMSRFRLANEPVPSAEVFQPETVQKAIDDGARLFRNPWTRLTWIESANGARLYATGQAFDCSIELAESLCQSQYADISPDRLDYTSLTTLTQLINKGHFLLQAPG